MFTKETESKPASALMAEALRSWAMVALFLGGICGCQTSGKQDLHGAEIKKWRVSGKAVGRSDSLVETEETRAISNIPFGIAEPEFEAQLEIFLKKSRQPDSVGENGGKFYNHAMGDYIFSSVHPSFHQNKLYRIDIQGKYIGYEKYTAEIPHQKEVLDRLLTAWFGIPEFNRPAREWYHTEHNHRYESGRWRAGGKVIETYISNRGHHYTYDLSIFLSEIETLKGKPKTDVR